MMSIQQRKYNDVHVLWSKRHGKEGSLQWRGGEEGRAE